MGECPAYPEKCLVAVWLLLQVVKYYSFIISEYFIFSNASMMFKEEDLAFQLGRFKPVNALCL